jgi:hypothetical protein
MKKSIIFLFLLSTFLYGQYDSVFVEVKDDSVIVWNTKVEENCAFSVVFNVDISDSLITIVEHDTTTMHVTCTCMVDLSVNLVNLETKNYTVNVYRKHAGGYNPDSLYYIGSTHFSYTKLSGDTLKKSYYQSKCYYPQSIEDQETIPDDFFILKSYPNPFNSQTNFKVYLPYKTNIELKLYDNLGKVIKVLASGSFSKGFHTFKFDGDGYASGNYFITLESGNKRLKTLKVSLLK